MQDICGERRAHVALRTRAGPRRRRARALGPPLKPLPSPSRRLVSAAPDAAERAATHGPERRRPDATRACLQTSTSQVYAVAAKLFIRPKLVAK